MSPGCVDFEFLQHSGILIRRGKWLLSLYNSEERKGKGVGGFAVKYGGKKNS
ncbi:unnamed protein product, partial [Vitis vinifera]|uniref:Uncharacterized protein n=1 Tax=Vitis vinifera TaxID=29760 RepID=D7TKI5_VITVI